jgi:hypothetical protein
MAPRTYTVTPAPLPAHTGRHRWRLALDGSPLSDEFGCLEAIDVATRLARSDWALRRTPAKVMVADENGALGELETFGLAV